MGGKAILPAAALLAACQSDAGLYQTQVLTPPEAPLSRSREVVIQMPADGSFRGAVYYGSGRDSGNALQRSFAEFASKASLVRCVPGACDRGSGYFVVAQVLNWEDRATGWSGNRDRIAMKVTISDAVTGKVLSSHVVLSAGTLTVRLSSDLLPSTTSRFVGSLY